MGDVHSLAEHKLKKAAKKAEESQDAKVKRFEECLSGVVSIWEAALKDQTPTQRDKQMIQLVNRVLEPRHLIAVDPFIDEAARIERSLGLRIVIHSPGTMGGWSNPGYCVVGIFNQRDNWGTPAIFVAERFARWFNIILYLKLVEDGLVPDQVGSVHL